MKDLILGTANFGMAYGGSGRTAALNLKEIEDILLTAQNQKIMYLDTAIGYGDAEQNLGKIGVSNFRVISKISSLRFQSDVKDYVIKSVEESCLRLGVDTLDGLLIHDPKDLTCQNREDIFSAFNRVKEQGLVGRIGASLYSPNDLQWEEFDWNIDMLQVPINIFDSRFKSADFFKEATFRGIEIHARSIFLQGQLLIEMQDLNRYFHTWLDYFIAASQHEKNFESKVQMCVVHVNSLSEPTGCVFGVSSSKQLNEIVGALLLGPHQAPESIQINQDAICDPRQWQL